jgi:hypothetical protein
MRKANRYLICAISAALIVSCGGGGEQSSNTKTGNGTETGIGIGTEAGTSNASTTMLTWDSANWDANKWN